MVEIGQALKTKRKELGLSLAVIEEQTKIRRRYLEAIEDGDWSILPGDVYARGFVRAYAEAVGLDGNELLAQARFAHANPTPASDSNPAPVQKEVKPAKQVDSVTPPVKHQPAQARPARARTSPQRASRPARGRRGGFGVNAGQVAFVVVVLVLLGGAWWALELPHGNNANGSHASNSQSGLTNNTSGTNGTAVAGNGATGNQAAGNSASANNTTGSPPPAPAVQITPSPSANGDVTYTVTSTPAKPLTATLTTTSAPCWVRITKDGQLQSAGGETLAVNSSKTWNANQSLVIRVGNLNGLSLTIDGQPVTLPQVNHPVNVTIVNKAK